MYKLKFVWYNRLNFQKEESIVKKIAVIELGTLFVKMTVAKALDNETFETIEQTSDSIRIASDLYEDWLIKPARTQELIVILKNYKAFCQTMDVQTIECVASFEYLDAKNHSSFIEEIYSQTGFKFKIMQKDEQMLYAYTAVINSLDVPKGLIIAVDGNKTQILNYSRRNLLNQATFDFGSCNLADYCQDSTLSPEEYCTKMLKKFEKELEGLSWLKEVDPETQIVGVGSIFSSIGKLSRRLKKYPYDKEHNYQMSVKDFEDVYNFVKVLDIDKTRKIKGISSDRADVLASGICIVKSIVDNSICQSLVVSQNSVAEGLLFNIASPITLEKPITDILGYSLAKNTEAYNTYSTNTDIVYSLSMLLYKQLKVLHKLPRTYVKILRVASTMHDCGKRIDSRNYQKNGFDIVLKSDLYGVTHREQILGAFAVACQKTEDFNMLDFVKYREILTDEDMDAVKKLGVIVRMADALDRFNKNKIQDITCDILGDSVILKTIVDTNAEMEIREALRAESDFVKAFRKRLEIL